MFGVPLVGTNAPKAGFTFTAPLTIDFAEDGRDNVLHVGHKVTLTFHDPILLDHARDLVERTVELSLTPVD